MDTKIPPLIHNSCSLRFIYISLGPDEHFGARGWGSSERPASAWVIRRTTTAAAQEDSLMTDEEGQRRKIMLR